MFEYDAYGLRWGSSLALPFAERSGGRPDVTVRFGGTPAHLPAARGNAPHAWEAEPGAALLRVADVARYLVTPREIVIDRRGGDAEDIAAFLVGPVAGALLLQRGAVPLHAAAVGTDAGTVLLLGSSGAGKSALAAALVERGAALVADDVTGLSPAGDGVLALPAFPRLRLWADALPPADRRQRVRRNLEQYWKPAARFCAAPQPVRAAFVLESRNRRDFDIAPVPSSRAFWTLWEHTYRRRLVDALGQRPAHWRTGMALARSVPFVRARRPDRPFAPGALADRIEACLRGIAIPAAASSAGGARCQPRRARCARHRPHRLAERRAPSGPGIVWIAAYPKSGSTWLRAVLTNYLRDAAEPASINALVGSWGLSVRDKFDELIGLDSSDLGPAELARCLPPFRELLARELSAPRPGRRGRGPCFSKTHEAYRGPVGGPRFPSAGAAGVVHLVRNPLDVAASYAYHLQWRVDRVLRRMNDPAADEAQSASGISKVLPNPMTTWSGHVSSWLDQTALRTRTVRYEDLLADPRAGFGAIVRFAGLQWDAEAVERAVERSAFPRLRAQEAEAGFDERQPTAPSFFRAGAAGSWRTALTRRQVRAVVDAHGPAMARLGYLDEAETFLDGPAMV